MKNIAIVTCKKRLYKVDDDLIIRDNLINNGYNATIVSWEDKSVNWLEFDVVFIRTVWNSSINYKKYCCFLEQLKSFGVKVINDVDIIKDNICKQYNNDNKELLYIESNYKKFYSSVFNTVNNMIDSSLVLKPIIGESSYHVYRFNKDGIKTKNSKKLSFIVKKIFKDYKKYGNPGIIIERFNEDIYLGEYCVYYFNNHIVYCIKKFPSVFQERKPIEYIDDIPKKIITYIKNNKLIEGNYGRIDVLYNKKVYLMEVERNDPDLYLRRLDTDTCDKVLTEIIKMISGVLND